MTNGDKMRELVSSDSKDSEIVRWAYMNRVYVSDLPFEEEFETMRTAVESFEKSEDYSDDETKNFVLFLKREWEGD